MVADLEKRLFECERERVLLRRERDQLKQQSKVVEADRERGTVSQQMVAMVQANQLRLDETNAAMLGLVQRQEREMREREEAWSAQVSQLKQLIQNSK